MFTLKIEKEGLEDQGEVATYLSNVLQLVHQGYRQGDGWDISEGTEIPQDPNEKGSNSNDTTLNAPQGGSDQTGAPEASQDQTEGYHPPKGAQPAELLPWEEHCVGCEGYGRFVIHAAQIAGDIVDEVEQECKLCNGTGKVAKQV